MSPRGISPTNSRLDYLMKAKASRQRKNEERRKMSYNNGITVENGPRNGLLP